MNLREQLEHREDRALAPWAMRARDSRGRLGSEPEHAYRTCFQRDRDRVLHSTAFRRLQYKTQVFIHHEGDHFRNRLTHTLEVAQIGRTIARVLGANEDLTEAIVLAHDLGHTPFGHAGERAMHPLLEAFGGFEHNRQSLRIVDWLELRTPEYRGLNLTHETRAGILKHGRAYPRHSHPVEMPSLGASPTAEAQIANWADSIAYGAHDIDDGLRSGLLEPEQLEELELWRRARERAGLSRPLAAVGWRKVIVRLIDGLVGDLVEATARRLEKHAPTSADALCTLPEPVVGLSDEARELTRAQTHMLHECVYRHPQVLRMALKGERILRELWEAYSSQPRLLPRHVLAAASDEPPERAMADYLAGMTDRFAMDEHRRIYDPHTPA